MERKTEPLISGRPSELNPYAAPVPIQNAPAPPVSVGGDSEPSPEVFEELQRVANYRHVHKALKASGAGSIVFGVIAMVVGFTAMRHNPINVILRGIGVLLAVEGLWLVIAPAPIGIIVDGVSLMLVGAWNIWVTVMNMAAGQHTATWGVIGVFQIIWGIQAFGRYSRFSKMPREQPAPETLKRIDQIVGDITRTKIAQDPQAIEFKVKMFTATQPWKGRLRHNHAVFVGPGGKDIIFARANDVVFNREGKVLIGKTIKAKFQIADRTFKGTISPVSFERYEGWKKAESGSAMRG
jgi:hypothetical protein